MTSRSGVVAGVGPTVGSSLFGPLRGWSLEPITRSDNGEGDQLKQAISGKTSRPSLAALDERAAMARPPILAQ
jgi:hypothetical protein